jgi:hypothetical protein
MPVILVTSSSDPLGRWRALEDVLLHHLSAAIAVRNTSGATDNGKKPGIR